MLLAIDATTKTASCALSKDGMLLAFTTLNSKKTHSQTLLPLIDQILKQCDAKVSDIRGIIVANGPGSFTGLRIALSTVKALAHPFNTPIYAVSTLKALSYHGKRFSGLVCPILDARRGQVYTAVYDHQGAVIKADTWKMVDLLEKLEGKKVLFVGDGVPVHRGLISDILGESAYFGDQREVLNTAIGLFDAYEQGDYTLSDYKSLEADYLRKPQAERELEEKSKC
ncbi:MULTISPECIES: tRNA (adenosine(37)-N6)-threonylcarbamoyltransferase complex dimerization subunit type 1 TsaB [unclassified Fusibacter]|uniref:tRNA (adenosine(37)-N6)-threonylcarbamoyltransferase complex dimerization subunit type 1 TsaB n=1 Tax=unclassified Fusibacter TaxID=2624464 RepID=UPI0013E97484|nr:MULTISPECIES: tRNA (adenosine(37)-N6)-threonylcarbamoyltransferase complex dimerization subunit type 1 TsaB [unclassified Fusibacter]MCK8059439.1 tRNA (adenosine(37)-N6)-threonylcarbamoyltransferase complex dimerization subunit type 1 TsaB [Fusibacter sp. A2]NPE21097.1 tRNA (adenosine(37)-N6)-threonylcarbamoyltransferase complex dimerization subunit type 1 TsaB [Fusibacter sp. A1]